MLHSNILIGCLDAFFETGTEGIIWAFIDNNATGWDALNILNDGDYLFIEDGEGGIAWEGKVLLDYEIPKRAQLSGAMQQEVCGYWVHGLQKGVKPEDWAQWFLTSRPAVLRKAEYAPFTE